MDRSIFMTAYGRMVLQQLSHTLLFLFLFGASKDMYKYLSVILANCFHIIHLGDEISNTLLAHAKERIGYLHVQKYTPSVLNILFEIGVEEISLKLARSFYVSDYQITHST
jgi:hypothetical protein